MSRGSVYVCRRKLSFGSALRADIDQPRFLQSTQPEVLWQPRERLHQSFAVLRRDKDPNVVHRLLIAGGKSSGRRRTDEEVCRLYTQGVGYLH